MIDFYIACGLLFIGLGWVAWHRLTHPETTETDPAARRINELERKVAELETRLKAGA